MMLKVVYTTAPKTTIFVNFIPLQPLGLFITTLLVSQRWRIRHEGNPTHVANSDEIRCGIHKEDGHYIIDCTKEQ